MIGLNLDVDSSEVAFKIAASKAFQEGVQKATPILLEPIMKVEVTVPDTFMGDVIGDINAKRGQVKEMNDRGNLKIIDSFVPLSEIRYQFLSLCHDKTVAFVCWFHCADRSY